MKHYSIDEFITAPTELDPINTMVEKKISLLYDFRILKFHDSRANNVRAILCRCPNEYAMTRQLRDLLVGNITLDDWIKRGE